jgi:hypothetical protein
MRIWDVNTRAVISAVHNSIGSASRRMEIELPRLVIEGFNCGMYIPGN